MKVKHALIGGALLLTATSAAACVDHIWLPQFLKDKICGPAPITQPKPKPKPHVTPHHTYQNRRVTHTRTETRTETTTQSSLEKLCGNVQVAGEFCDENDRVTFYQTPTDEQLAKGYTIKLVPAPNTPDVVKQIMADNTVYGWEMRNNFPKGANGIYTVTFDYNKVLINNRGQVVDCKTFRPTLTAPDCVTAPPTPTPEAPPAPVSGTPPSPGTPLTSTDASTPDDTARWRADIGSGKFDWNIKDVNQQGKVNVYNYTGQQQSVMLEYASKKNQVQMAVGTGSGTSTEFCPLGDLTFTKGGIFTHHAFTGDKDRLVAPEVGLGLEGSTFNFKDVGQTYTNASAVGNVGIRIGNSYAGNYARIGVHGFIQNSQLQHVLEPNGSAKKADAFTEIGYGPQVEMQHVGANGHVITRLGVEAYKRQTLNSSTPAQEASGTGVSGNLSMGYVFNPQAKNKLILTPYIAGEYSKTDVPQGVSPQTNFMQYGVKLGYTFGGRK